MNKHFKNKMLAMAIILLMALMGGATVFTSVKAALPPLTTNPTYAGIDVSPNPVGVGQQVFIEAWIIEFDPLTSVANGVGWTGFQVTVTAPNNQNTTLGPYNATDAATIGVPYTPTQVGNYTFTFNFPGQLVSSATAGINTQYLPSTSSTTIMVVQNPIAPLPETPLPTAYWTRPIDWQNQYWYSISGNWMGDIGLWNLTAGQAPGQSYNAYSNAPLTSHIMWCQPYPGSFGGQIGGISENDLSNYYTGKSYEQFQDPPVVINGIMYYSKPSGVPPTYGVYAIDIRTGKQLFYMNVTGLTFGEVYDHHNPNEVGGLAYLWTKSGTTMSLYDATTGNLILTITGATSGTSVVGPNGEILSYAIQPINQTYGYLSMWNSTQCLWAAENGNPSLAWEYRPTTGGGSLKWSTGVQFNVTVPIFSETTPPSITVQFVDDGYVLAVGGTTPQSWEMEAGYDASTGALLWSTNRSIGMTQEIGGTSGGWIECAANGIYIEHNKEQGTYYAFSMASGAQVWGPTVPDTNVWDSDARDATSDGSAVYIQGAGTVQAYNLTNGAHLWSFTPPAAGLQFPTSTYLLEGMYTLTLGGGELFVGTGDSHGDQLFRGSQFYALNTTTGKPVWNIDGLWSQGHSGSNPLADGYYVAFNGYDNQLYSFGQGPTKTTVNAPQIGATTATPITITGTITDISAGSQQDAVAANYPNGLPCVSDASMSGFMQAVYMQQPMPTNITGVPVTISVLDSNGNYRQIGTTTSDLSGTFSLTWTPDIPGNYTVYANFAGSGAYYGSSAETHLYAGTAAATTAPVTTAQANLVSTVDLMTYMVAGVVAIIIAIAAATVVIIKKRP